VLRFVCASRWPDDLAALEYAASHPLAPNHPIREIAHTGAWLWRKEKLESIAGEDLVRRHLRVCWQSRDSQMNCGFCEKCLRTILVLAQAGQLEHFPVFAGSVPLAERLNRLPPLAPTYFPNYEEFLRDSKDPQVTEALRALLRRSRAQQAGWHVDYAYAAVGIELQVTDPVHPHNVFSSESGEVQRTDNRESDLSAVRVSGDLKINLLSSDHIGVVWLMHGEDPALVLRDVLKGLVQIVLATEYVIHAGQP
jgi:hypothetical protein